MPEDYLAASDDKMKGLMSRHRTLSDSNIHLVDKLESMSDEVKALFCFFINKCSDPCVLDSGHSEV